MIESFELACVTWSVKIDEHRMNDMSMYGLCEHGKSQISLYSDIGDVAEQTFYHELIHAMFDSLDRKELSNDEF